ncbi:MAG: hypothetical protein DI535_28395 [Citrobacter freundii]|nr:MAG: hypothetical protein DI535_28395 [Citrobacter freundii]
MVTQLRFSFKAMNDFIKKYRYTIIWVTALCFLLFFFLPAEEERYSRQELIDIKHVVKMIVIGAIMLLSFVSIIIIVVHQKTVGSFFTAFAAVAFWGLAGFLFLEPIFLSGALFLNKLIKREMPAKVYIASLVEHNTVILREEKQNNMLLMESLEKQAAKKGVAISDTVLISFKKGLLGFEFDPRIKEIRPVKVEGNTIANDAGQH